MMSFEDEIPLYHPQEITYQIGCQPEQPFPVHHLTGNLYDETKSRVESLTELQTKLLNWMKPMTPQERQQKLTFVSRDFVNLIKKMYIRRYYFNEFVFRVDEDPVSKQLVVEGKKGYPPSEKIQSFRAEEDLLRGIIFYHKNQAFDSISICQQFVQNVQKLFELFSTIVDGIAFEISEDDCRRLELAGSERFFYQPYQTSFYLQGLGKWLVSVFTQQLWCEYYRSIRQPNFKRPKDKYRKKINHFWKDLPVVKKLEVLEAGQPQYFLQKLSQAEFEGTRRRVPKYMSEHVLTGVGIERYLKSTVEIQKDFYEKMKVCSLNSSYVQEAELGWFVIQKIKDYLQKRFQEAQIPVKVVNVFIKKGKPKKKKDTHQKQVKQVNKQKIIEAQSPKLPKITKNPKTQQKKLANKEISNKTFECDQQIQTQKQQNAVKQFHKPSMKRKRNTKRKINLQLTSQEESGSKSKRETSTSSPRASEISNQPKPVVSQSDVQANEKDDKQDGYQHQPSCCQFDRHDEEENNLDIQDQINLEDNAEQLFEPSEDDYLRRLAEIKVRKQHSLNRTIEQYSFKLRQHASKFQYSRMVAYNRLFYMLSHLTSNLNVYGSWATGFILADSDIDIAINPFILNYFVACYGSARDKIVSALYTIKAIIEQKPWVKVYKMLDQAQVPVLKFSIDTSKPFEESALAHFNVPKQNASSVISIDLTIQQFQSVDKSHVGLLASSLMNEWKQRYPCVLPICLTIKQLLRKKKMGEVYTGGLSPYCVMIMLVAFLKHSDLSSSTNYGTVLIQFLAFYTSEFDYRSIGINATQQLTSPYFCKEESQGLILIEPISKKIIKSAYHLLPQILDYFRSLKDILLDSTSYLDEFKDPRDLIIELPQQSNVLLKHCSVELI